MISAQPETSNSKPETNEHRQNRICFFSADFAADEGAGGFADGAGAADEGVAAVYHKGAALGCELLVPDGGEAGERIEDGFLPGSKATGRGQECPRKQRLRLTPKLTINGIISSVLWERKP